MTEPRLLHLLLLLPPLLTPAAATTTTAASATTSFHHPCPAPCTCQNQTHQPLQEEGDLRTVNCSGHQLQAVPRGLPADSQALVLRDNNLTDLYGQFPAMPGLLLLDLSCNQVRSLGRGLVFRNLSELRVLNLSRNDFRSVFNGVFRGIHALRRLEMTRAQLRFVEEHVFDGLRDLRQLRLAHNQLSAVFPEWFRDLEHLEELHLQNNHIAYLNSGTFAPLVSLRRLQLSGNRIRGASDKAFDGLANLTDLSLEDNQLSRVPAGALKAVRGVRLLKLGGNAFPQLRTGDFVRLRAEEVFVENAAALELVDRGAFWDLPYLRALHLHHNARLAFVDPEAFLNVPNLRILSLHGNNLSALSGEALKAFRRPLQISLRDNPLLCDCNVKWIRDATSGPDTSKIRMLDADALSCDRPVELRQVKLKSLNASEIPDTCPPVLVGPPNSTVEKKVDDAHVFQCRAHGIPVPSVHWILPSEEVLNQTSSDTHVHLQSPGSLGISHLKPRDSGPYTCVARNPLGEAARVTHLTVHNIDIHLFPLGVASTFVTVVWNGTARGAFPEYEIIYRKEDGGGKARAGQYKSVTVSQFFRSYTINHLQPRSTYRLCIGVKSKEDRQYVQFSCTRVRTRDEGFMSQGVTRTSNVAVALVIGIVVFMTAVVCAVAVAARKYRQRQYSTPQKALVASMAQIPMENLHSPLISSHLGQ